MTVRINSTGRRKIPLSQITIRTLYSGTSAPIRFDAQLSLANLKLPADAKVYLEAYVKSSVMRFDYGTIGLPIEPPERGLSELDAGAAPMFRIKVVDESENIGRILAVANGIHPESDVPGQDRTSLLPLATADLGELIWDLSINQDTGPCLTLNNRIPGIAERLPVDPILQGAIFPAVVKRLVQAIYPLDPDSDDNWAADWHAWFTDQLGQSPEDLFGDELTEDIQQVADEIANSFAKKQAFASRAATLFAGPSHA